MAKAKQSAEKLLNEFLAAGEQGAVVPLEEFFNWLNDADPKHLKKLADNKRFSDKAKENAELTTNIDFERTKVLIGLGVMGLAQIPDAALLAMELKENIAKVMHYLEAEKSLYAKQVTGRAKPGNKNASKYSEEVIKQATTKFNSLSNTLSQKRRAELTVASLDDPKPSWQTILTWLLKTKTK